MLVKLKNIDKNHIRKQGIYALLNTKNNKVYIGSSVRVGERVRGHLNELSNQKHNNDYLQKAYSKDKENFVFKFVEEVEDKKNLLDREQYWIDTLESYKRDCGYNIVRYAGNTIGYKHTQETKQWLSNFHKELRNSEEWLNGKAQLQKGENAYNTKLTNETVEEIKLSILKGVRFEILMERYDTSRHILNDIKNTYTWIHIRPDLNDKVKNYKYENIRIGENTNSAKLTSDKVEEIKNILLYTDETMTQIGEMYEVSFSTISTIKNGYTWLHVKPELNEKINIIRHEKPKVKLNIREVKEIKQILAHTKLEDEDISIMYNVCKDIIKDIRLQNTWKDISSETNDIISKFQCKKHKILGENNKLAKLSNKEVKEIKHILLKTDLSEREIAIMYEVNYKMVESIKLGNSWKHILPELSESIKTHRPIKKYRKNRKGRVSLTESEVKEIKQLLLSSTMTLKKIGEIYNVSRPTIGNIKKGKTWSHVKI